jgi:tetratricopeptide (TPR) repeat protein
MSMTLNLADRLLAKCRNYQTLGRDRDALLHLKRLAGFRELPAEVAEETQARLGELQIKRQKYTRARRHLTAALRCRPDSARYHYLMALAVESDERTTDTQRAADHYRRSLELEPEQAECLARYGSLLLTLGKRDEGLECLRRGVDLDPSNPDAVGKLAAGLRLGGQVDEARAVLREAMFCNNRDARFQRLWNDFQFGQARREQEAARRGVEEVAGPVLLPFARPTVAETTKLPGGRTIRIDGPATLPAPNVPRPASKSDRRNVQ